MRPVRVLAVAVILLLVGIPGSAKPPKVGLGVHPKADKQFDAGQFRLAARAYRSTIERDPTDLLAVFGLARSQAALNDCSEPLQLLSELRKSPAWGPQMAVLEGACRQTIGDFSGAEVAFEETLELGGEPWRVLPRLAEVQLAAGDLDGFEATLDRLRWEDDSGDLVAVLRAREGVERGLPDADERIDDARRMIADKKRGKLDVELLELDARRWLDVDEPGLARELLLQAVMLRNTDAIVAAWSLEAGRRDGDEVRVLAGSDREGIRLARGALLDAVRARILIDVGDTAAAVQILDEDRDIDHPELLATRWYLARATHDEAAERKWAARWAEGAIGGSLDPLVPTWAAPLTLTP